MRNAEIEIKLKNSKPATLTISHAYKAYFDEGFYVVEYREYTNNESILRTIRIPKEEIVSINEPLEVTLPPQYAGFRSRETLPPGKDDLPF